MLLAGFVLCQVLTPTWQLIVDPRQASSSSSSIIHKQEGWKELHYFYGNDDLLIDRIPTDRWIAKSKKHQAGLKWFSQHGQDISVMKALGFARDGYFVDLAANNAVWASNSFALEQNFGWTGICIEPNSI